MGMDGDMGGAWREKGGYMGGWMKTWADTWAETQAGMDRDMGGDVGGDMAGHGRGMGGDRGWIGWLWAGCGWRRGRGVCGLWVGI